MEEIIRFGVSIEKNVLNKFDEMIKKENYPTRSKAIGDLIRESLIKREWLRGGEVAGAITLVYNHHRRELVDKLTDIQHDYHNIVISTLHIHLDYDNCLEIVAVKGNAKDIVKLSNLLKSTKGIKHSSMIVTTTGKEV
ncbi:MAG: nickel-responsive transcriptional regulator NikR [Caldisericia bacterium]